LFKFFVLLVLPNSGLRPRKTWPFERLPFRPPPVFPYPNQTSLCPLVDHATQGPPTCPEAQGFFPTFDFPLPQPPSILSYPYPSPDVLSPMTQRSPFYAPIDPYSLSPSRASPTFLSPFAFLQFCSQSPDTYRSFIFTFFLFSPSTVSSCSPVCPLPGPSTYTFSP